MDEISNIISGSFAPGGVTVATLVIAILFAGGKGMWYYGTTYRETAKDRDDWKNIAVAATEANKVLTDQNEKLVDVNETLTHALGVRKR